MLGERHTHSTVLEFTTLTAVTRLRNWWIPKTSWLFSNFSFFLRLPAQHSNSQHCICHLLSSFSYQWVSFQHTISLPHLTCHIISNHKFPLHLSSFFNFCQLQFHFRHPPNSDFVYPSSFHYPHFFFLFSPSLCGSGLVMWLKGHSITPPLPQQSTHHPNTRITRRAEHKHTGLLSAHAHTRRCRSRSAPKLPRTKPTGI